MILICLTCLLPEIIYSQEDTTLNIDNTSGGSKAIFGFIRGGLYAGFESGEKDIPYVSSAFSDVAIKIQMENGINFKAFADLRFRYGAEFLKPVNNLNIREAYIRINGNSWNLSLGQEIIKWGRADFTNPTSKLNPQNFILRSPDREDMDIGNILSSFNWYPAEIINIQVVLVPFYRSSVLIIEPIQLPANVAINQIGSLLTGKEMFSYGLKADLHLKGIDLSLSWFDGYDPIPGTSLTKFSLDLTGLVPIPLTELSLTPYKIRTMGLDFETSAGSVGLRGEATWSVPYLLYQTNEYIPLPEIKWVAGADRSWGVWRFLLEYSGKAVTDFTPATVKPVIGTKPDYSQMADLLTIPGFDLEDYVRQQVGAFNRLYNYQIEKYYHTAGLRIESDLAYGKLAPSFFSIYNFTSRDLLVIPEIRYKPSDGITIIAGAEVFSGHEGSLYDIADGFMNSVYFTLKVDF
jgi:hypothetical protein